ncbi:MAG TPA: NAD(P)-dependent oxidoreductase [Bryobacteraceae bacterium]|nr:NAD(P)-dependent oxidoreductase [Bryobacteraceae bacterium]
MRGYEGTTAAVLGASGFIGRWVVRKLVEQGAHVCRIGREDTGDLAAIYRSVRPSITFNLAGYGIDPLECDEAEAYHVNADLPRMVAAAVAAEQDPEWPGQHFVHVGSGVEYGGAGGNLCEDGPAFPATLYAKSKWIGTQAVAEQSKALGFRAVIARLFTIYGPGERARRLLPTLLEARRTGQALDLSSGMQRRDFTYVEDAAEGLLKLGLVSEPRYAIVNLATGQLATVRFFAETAAAVLGIPPENLKFGAIPANLHEMQHEAVSLDRLKRLLAWIPPTSIAEGVRKTLEISLLEEAQP